MERSPHVDYTEIPPQVGGMAREPPKFHRLSQTRFVTEGIVLCLWLPLHFVTCIRRNFSRAWHYSVGGVLLLQNRKRLLHPFVMETFILKHRTVIFPVNSYFNQMTCFCSHQCFPIPSSLGFLFLPERRTFFFRRMLLIYSFRPVVSKLLKSSKSRRCPGFALSFEEWPGSKLEVDNCFALTPLKMILHYGWLEVCWQGVRAVW